MALVWMVTGDLYKMFLFKKKVLLNKGERPFPPCFPVQDDI